MMVGRRGRALRPTGTIDDARSVRRVRAGTDSDADTFSAWIVRDFPVPPALAKALPALLGRLIAEETLSTVVVEEHSEGWTRPTVAGFGISGFIGAGAAAQYLAAPSPHLELDLLERARRGQPHRSFLDYDEIARANAGEGLTLFPLVWLQRANDPCDPEARTLLTVGQQAFLRMHRGYRLARILKEAQASQAEAFVNGGFRERTRLPAGTALSFPGRRLACEHVVFEITRSEADSAMPGRAVEQLFCYRPPRCGFTRAEKQVLSRAAEGLVDAQIARQLGISSAAVALRWRSIYARVAEQVPSALQEYAPSATGRGRGHEKRRRVIAFVSEHPEEMRPYLTT
jgi:hypothetical protein